MITCDICQKILIQSGNSKLLYCPAQVELVECLNRQLKYHHSFVSLDKNNKIISKLITVPPYIFSIDYKENTTKVSKIISFQKSLKDDVATLDMNHEEVEYLKIDAAFDSGAPFPWHDLKKIEEKLKIYNLFS